MPIRNISHTEDRRIRKTKKQLKSGLIDLLLKKDIKDITIKELVEHVDINRSTFYLHYSSIYDLLNEIQDDFMKELQEVVDSYKDIQSFEESLPFLEEFLDTLKNNRELVRILLDVSVGHSFINSIEITLEQEIRRKIGEILGDSQLIPDNTYIFFRCGCTGLLEHWIINNCPDSTVSLANQLYHLVVDSLIRLQNNALQEAQQ